MTESEVKAIPDDSNNISSSNLDWQMNKRNLGEKCAFLYLNSLMADEELEVGLKDPKTIPVHKFILSIGSPVFYAMFNSDFIESRSQAKKIEIPDVEPEVFESLLQYLYLDTVVLHENNVIPILYCSKKYMIPLLTEKCVSYLCKIVKASNAISLMSKTRIYDCPEFWNKCWDAISKDPKSSFESNSFIEIDFTTLVDVLSKNNLKRSEIDVFKASLKWATARLEVCRDNDNEEEEENFKAMGVKKREILGSALNHIYFNKMSTQEICDCVVPSGLLSENEVIKAFTSIVYLQNINANLQDVPPSLQIYNLYNLIDFNVAYDYYTTSDNIEFTVNQTVDLSSVTVLSARSSCNISFNILRDGKDISNLTQAYTYDTNKKEVLCHFRNRVKLEPNFKYLFTVSTNSIGFKYYIPCINLRPSSVFSITSLRKSENYVTKLHYYTRD